MNAAALLLSVAGTLVVASAALAETACKPTQLNNPAPTLAEIYALAEGHAKAWKPDVLPVRIGNTTLGLLQPSGSSASWTLQVYSESANSRIAIDTFRGSLNCWADGGGAGRIPDLKANFFRDGLACQDIRTPRAANR